MSIPPAILDLRIAQPDKRPIHVWLPLFLLWPLLLALGIISLVLTILADVALLLVGQRYHHYTILLAHGFAALCETRGMVVRFSDAGTAVDMTVL